MLARIARAGVHTAAAGCAHAADVRLKAVLLHRIAAVVIDGDREEVVLDVGPVEFLARADEAAGFELIAGTGAGAGEQPFCADGRLVPPLQCRRQRHRFGARVLEVDLQMILQVLADAGQVMHQLHIECAQRIGRAHAGALQQLR